VALATNAEHQRDWRNRQRGTPPRDPKPHGSVAAARRHQRADEPLCDLCAPVWKAHQAEMYEKRMAKNAAADDQDAGHAT